MLAGSPAKNVGFQARHAVTPGKDAGRQTMPAGYPARNAGTPAENAGSLASHAGDKK